MQRVLILGPPGSGKSTLARRLGRVTGLPVFHLDQAYWRPGWIEAPSGEFKAAVERMAALPAWIIEGNYSDTMEPRLRRADTVILLDIPSWLATLRVVRRVILTFNRVRADMPEGCPERFDVSFFRFTWNWNRERRDRSLRLVKAFSGRKLVLRNRTEIHSVVSAAAGEPPPA